MARIRRVVTSRQGGTSASPYDTFNLGSHVGDELGAVLRNRARLADALALDPASLAWMNQVHGDEVTIIGSPLPDEPVQCDALVTATAGVALVVLAADCVPVLLAEPEAGIVGVAHAGREGVRRHVVSRTVEAMVELGARTEHVDVLLGPAICGGCYELPRDLVDQVESSAPGGAGLSHNRTPALDLRAALTVELSRLGVARVVSDPRCTAEDPTLFSHRRDEITGRQAGVVWMS